LTSSYFSAQSPTASPDLNRSRFTGFQPGSATHQQQFPMIPSQNPNASMSGPPTQGLFDCLKSEKQNFQTPTKHIMQIPQNHSIQENSFLNQSGFNQSRIMSPIPVPHDVPDFNSSVQQNQVYQTTSFNQSLSQFNVPNNNFWITVFGFPQSATSSILQHFSQCGTIIDKVFAAQNGNWIHLKFTSRLECDKALNYNGKIVSNNLMIGVMRCTDEAVVDKENAIEKRDYSINKIRPLTHIAYKNAQSPTEVVSGPMQPKRSTGIVSKAMDIFFGW
jgi:nuclear pore complex protein Nup53